MKTKMFGFFMVACITSTLVGLALLMNKDAQEHPRDYADWLEYYEEEDDVLFIS